MSALLMMCATALAGFSTDITPDDVTILGSNTQRYSFTDILVDDLTQFQVSVAATGTCPSSINMQITLGTGNTYPVTVSGGKLKWKGKVSMKTDSTKRTATLSHPGGSILCSLRLRDPSIDYTNDFFHDVASLAVGIIIALIVGGLVCCILIIVCIVCMCRRQGSTTTVVQQQPAPYQPMMQNDGYGAPVGGPPGHPQKPPGQF